MEKGFIALIATGAVAVWLYLSAAQESSAVREAQTAKHNRDSAEFDRDFKKAWTGVDDEKLARRADKANDELERKSEDEAKVTKEQMSKRSDMQNRIENEMSRKNDDLKASGKQLLEAK